MIEASAKTPAAKLLSVYSCLNSLLMSPAARETFTVDYLNAVPVADSCPGLSAYLVELATKAKIPSPTVYVAQMFILLQGAIAEELRNPGGGALLKAQDAAKCLMDKSRPQRTFDFKEYLLVFSSVVSATALCFIAILLPSLKTYPPTTQQLALVKSFQPTSNLPMMSPDVMGRTIALKESFDTGVCPAPQLINMPPDRVSAYINVVTTNFSDRSAADSEKLNAFLSWYEKYMAWECKTENNQKIVLGMAK